MSSRSFRLETRSRARDEIKRIMQTVEKVRKWEKKWIETGLSNNLKVYKWVPVREVNKEEEESRNSNKENQPADASGGTDTQTSDSTVAPSDQTLPEITATVKEPAVLDAPLPASEQPPSELFVASDEAVTDTQVATGDSQSAPATEEGGKVGEGEGGEESEEKSAEKEEQREQQENDVEVRRERQKERVASGEGNSNRRSRSRSRSPIP